MFISPLIIPGGDGASGTAAGTTTGTPTYSVTTGTYRSSQVTPGAAGGAYVAGSGGKGADSVQASASHGGATNTVTSGAGGGGYAGGGSGSAVVVAVTDSGGQHHIGAVLSGGGGGSSYTAASVTLSSQAAAGNGGNAYDTRKPGSIMLSWGSKTRRTTVRGHALKRSTLSLTFPP